MASCYRIPKLANPNIVVRVTNDEGEIEQANKLVFRNYVAAGFWEDNEDRWRKNKYLHTSARHVFVVMDRDRLLGTMSIIIDSPDGLPSDSAQPELMRDLRAKCSKLAEVSAFAMERTHVQSSKLCLLLMSYVLQYSFYYTKANRLVLSCVPTHANFYESVFCFSRLSGPTYYDYTRAVAYLLFLNLLEAHSLLYLKYSRDSAPSDFYRFLLCDPHPCHRFPGAVEMKRRRDSSWIELQSAA